MKTKIVTTFKKLSDASIDEEDFSKKWREFIDVPTIFRWWVSFRFDDCNKYNKFTKVINSPLRKTIIYRLFYI